MDARYPIRPIALSELPQYLRVGQHAFNSAWPSAEWLRLAEKVFEPERSLAAFDGDEIIGTTEVMSFELTVPGGGQVGCAGVTGVAVLPSHRRQGVLSSLMNEQLAGIAAGTEPVAALLASETAIYGRYGYGVATWRVRYSIKRGEARLRAPAKPLKLRLAAPRDVAERLAGVYDAIRPSRPGMLTRNAAYWDAMLADPEFMREGMTPERCVLAESESGFRGYALYSVQPIWRPDGIPGQVLVIRELFALDLDATIALWTDLFSRDLVGEITVRSRPVDDPLLHLLPDPRRARPAYLDGLWIRLIDLPAALTQRQYSCAVDLVLEVRDDRLPANAGRWRLQAGGPADQVKPSCELTSAEPDLTLPVAALGAAYLGGARLASLAETGAITEHRPGAVAALSTAMWWDPAPWAPTTF